MTSDDKIVNQRATLKGSGSAGTITSGCSENERDKRQSSGSQNRRPLTTEPQHHGILPADTLDALPMKAVKYTKEGVVIPSSWMKGWGKAVVAHRDSDVLILESPARAASRKKLARMVGKVRRAARELSITPEQIAAEVAAVRRERARRS
jgi:hypothetical protein